MSTQDVTRATNEFLAEELAADAKAAEQAQEVAEALNPPAPPAAQAAPEQQLPQINAAHLQKFAGVVLTVVDRIIVAQAGKAYALTDAEKTDIATAAVPVLQKHVPTALGWLVTTPEGVFLTTVGIIYGSKFGLDVTGLMPTEETPAPATAANDNKETAS